MAETVLREAERLVYGDRGKAYGHPLDDYTRTARMWSAILDTEVSAEQAIMCMIAVKLSRECNAGKRDNRVDIAGYAECLQRVQDERRRRAELDKMIDHFLIEERRRRQRFAEESVSEIDDMPGPFDRLDAPPRAPRSPRCADGE